MSKSATIRVTAAPGRIVPVHSTVATGRDGKQLRITSADVVEVPNVLSVRRRIASGDLIELKADAKKTHPKQTKE